MGLPNILRALALLKEHPNYRFVLDQACYVKPFLERHPEEEADFRRFVREGRLAIVGGTDVMPDVNMPGGESFVRQVLYGKGYFRQKLGLDVTVGWQLDTFGHHPQMPQLLKLGGYKSFWIQRGVADPNTPSEFLWEGIDGSQVPAFWLPHSYAVTYGSPADLPAFVDFFKQRFDALGPYSVYRLLPLRTAAAATVTPPNDEPVLENEFYRVEINPASGAMTRLLAKSPEWNVLSGPGNVVAREEDRGDVWELYHNLGAGFVTNKTPHPAPQPGKAEFSSDYAGTPGQVSRGPVLSEFHVAHPFGGQNSFATTVRLVAGLRRIEIRTQILNNEKSVRYRVLFPTSIPDGQSWHEIPFGAIQRPVGIELPAQNWVDYGNGDKGLAVLNRGLPGNNVAEGTMMVSLARSTRIQAYGYGGGYEPGMSSDSGFELGKELTFDYALVPHAGDWRQAGVYRDGMEFNHPLLAHTAGTHSGVLPKRWGLLDIAPQNVVVSALKPGADGTAVLRIYEAAGQPTKAKLRFSATVEAAEEVNLMEDPGHKLAVADNGLQFDLRAFEIKTIKLRLGTHVARSR